MTPPPADLYSTSAQDDIARQKELICALPKTEIHLHLEGIASVNTLWHLIQTKNLKIGISTREELVDRFRIHSLNEFVSLFVDVIQACINTAEDLGLLLNDARDYLLENNIRYAEIFYSPTQLIRNGIPFENLVATLTDGAARIEEETGIVVRFITDVSRGFGVENAHNNFLNHLRHSSKSMIGLGLGGAERSSDVRDFRHIFREAAESGMAIVAHAGEDSGPKDVWKAIRYLGIERVGHGTSAMHDSALIDYFVETQLPLEVCPTSNLYTGRYVSTLSEHPVRLFYDRGVNVTINTDDPTLFCTGLNEEYCKLLDSSLFNLAEILHMMKNGVYATFLPLSRKNELWGQVEKKIAAWGARDGEKQRDNTPAVAAAVPEAG